MVQIWPGIPPDVLCDMYLNSSLNEVLNLLIRHNMARDYKIIGYAETGCIEYTHIPERVYDLLSEMHRRGKPWSYKFTKSDSIICETYFKDKIFPFKSYNKMRESILANPMKLKNKCLSCRFRKTTCHGKETCVERLNKIGLI